METSGQSHELCAWVPSKSIGAPGCTKTSLKVSQETYLARDNGDAARCDIELLASLFQSTNGLKTELWKSKVVAKTPD